MSTQVATPADAGVDKPAGNAAGPWRGDTLVSNKDQFVVPDQLRAENVGGQRAKRSGWYSWLAALTTIGVVLSMAVRCFAGLAADVPALVTPIDAFMRAGDRNDPDTAFGFFSGNAQNTASRDAIVRLFGDHPDAFFGYRETQLTSWAITSGTDGTTANVEGIASYVGRPNQRFVASLVKDTDGWKVAGIQFLVGT